MCAVEQTPRIDTRYKLVIRHPPSMTDGTTTRGPEP